LGQTHSSELKLQRGLDSTKSVSGVKWDEAKQALYTPRLDSVCLLQKERVFS
jgi:hypothetical protein